VYAALLRAVNVGGTGKLPMAILKAMCEDAGFEQVMTYIASGNVIFASHGSKDEVRSALESRLSAYAGKEVGVIVRTAAEIADVLERNPFKDRPGNRIAVLFTNEPLPDDPLSGISGLKNEEVRPGKNELFVHYPDGMGRTKLRMPIEKHGTARNINTVRRLTEMTAALD
jgi:uncharacterized protein (DUF1697 family)